MLLCINESYMIIMLHEYDIKELSSIDLKQQCTSDHIAHQHLLRINLLCKPSITVFESYKLNIVTSNRRWRSYRWVRRTTCAQEIYSDNSNKNKINLFYTEFNIGDLE